MTTLNPTFDVDRAYFGRYLATVNKAMRELHRRPAARAALTELRARFDRRTFVVVLVGASRDGQSRFACTLCDLQFHELDQTPGTADGCWYVRREHVWDVLDQPWRYLADPSLIELPPFNAVRRPSPEEPTLRAPSEAGLGPNPQKSGRPRPTPSGLQ
ncbi:MAG: hypothetical protein ACE37F_10135 [Nannocystaceae bacterium]|nr:hypothetical protein [bacterium]